jgi:hypothetical protein
MWKERLMVNVFSVVLCGEAKCEDGHVHLLDVLHKLVVDSFPTDILALDLFMLASRDNGPNNHLDIKISPPDVTVAPSVVGRVAVVCPPGEIAVLSCRIECKYGSAGAYFFDVFCGSELIGQTKLILVDHAGKAEYKDWKPEDDRELGDWKPIKGS